VLTTVRERSVRARAEDVPSPPPFDSAHVAHGFQHYREMCVVCHGAPGVERGEFGLGMNPQPPDLSESAERLDTQELFWIVKHGIRMAGMPAFGVTHSDDEIWGVVLFVQELSRLTAAEYRSLDARAHAMGDVVGHAHGTAPGGAEAEGMTHANGHAEVAAAAAVAGHAHVPQAGAGRAAPPATTAHDLVAHERVTASAEHGQAGAHAPAAAVTHGAVPHAGAAAESDQADAALLELARELVTRPAVQRAIEMDPAIRKAWADSAVRRLILQPR
jgi:mono/diheme cytochrome c family protein